MFKKSVAGKTFILVIPSDFGIYELFNYNIEKFGFKLISVVPEEFKYRNTRTRIINFLYKTILRDRKYKQRIIAEFHSDSIENQIKSFPDQSVDYVLIIRPDLLRTETICRLLKIGRKVVAYQWDGLDRFPKVFKIIKHFDKFLVFDQNDYEKYLPTLPNLRKSENFYFDFDQENPGRQNSKTVYYVGAYNADRTADLNYMINELAKYEVEFDVNLQYYPKTPPFKNANVTFFRNTITFAENIQRMKNAEFLLDLKVKEHSGLSLRFFEALRYEKKIITNNQSVLKYDFYHPQNIFVLYHDDINDLGTFLKSGYSKQSREIVDKYSFSSWLNKYVIED